MTANAWPPEATRAGDLDEIARELDDIAHAEGRDYDLTERAEPGLLRSADCDPAADAAHGDPPVPSREEIRGALDSARRTLRRRGRRGDPE